MSLATDEMEERQYYPYYMLIGHKSLPFRTAEERVIMNKMIDEFVAIIESEKSKSEKLQQRINDIDFKVLLARPPSGKFKQFVRETNFESIEPDSEERDVLWRKWESQYAFKD